MRLTLDARKVADLSLPTLTQMFTLFSGSLETGVTGEDRHGAQASRAATAPAHAFAVVRDATLAEAMERQRLG